MCWERSSSIPILQELVVETVEHKIVRVLIVVFFKNSFCDKDCLID